MTPLDIAARRRLAVGLGAATIAVAASAVGAPTAFAAPCTASGLASTASGVLGAAAPWLEAHPGANDVLTQAATQPSDVARDSVRGYFMSHPGEFLELNSIAQPLKDLRAQCGIAISPSQIGALLDTMG